MNFNQSPENNILEFKPQGKPSLIASPESRAKNIEELKAEKESLLLAIKNLTDAIRDRGTSPELEGKLKGNQTLLEDVELAIEEKEGFIPEKGLEMAA